VNFPIIENLYHFECTRCGNCCTGDQQVLLNPYDLYKMARFKGFLNSRELFEKHLVQLVQHENKAWMPQIKFKSISTRKHKFCPFLINELDEHNKLLGLCSLHPHKKPLICAMSPVGRTIDFSDNSQQFIFVNPAEDCPGVDIKKENFLDDLIVSLDKELQYEKQFLRILDSLIEKNVPREYYANEIYYFALDKSFVEVLQQIERNTE
jgi:Fe-S-cluster containining protein